MVTFTNADRDAINHVLKNGGSYVMTVQSSDISSDASFETSPHIAPDLYTGFRLDPSPSIEDPKADALVLRYGDGWLQVISAVHRRGGHIIYKKLPTGDFGATIKV